MASTTLLLREEIDSLGTRGQIVKVRAGYARNYLLPRRLAVEATANNVKQIEREREALLKREAAERSTAEAQRQQMSAIKLTFASKAGERGVLYGSVTTMDIAEKLNELGHEIDRRRIHLPSAIKETGEFTVSIKLHREVSIDLPLIVTDEHGAIFKEAEESASKESTASGQSTTPHAPQSGKRKRAPRRKKTAE